MRFIKNSIFLILFSQAVIAQELIRGKTVDRVYQHPLDSVEILINGKKIYTDKKGEFSFIFNEIPLEISVIDYRYFPKSVMVNDTDLFKIKLTNRGLILNDLIVRSNFFTEKLKDVSLSASILDDLDTRKNEGEFIVKSLNEIPGVYSHSAGLNTNRITIRGMGSRTPYSTNKIKAYINNIPLSNGVGELSLEDFGIDIFSQIEVTKGPNSSIYGSGLGGNILLNTERLSDKFLNISSSFKSYKTYQNRFSLSKKINNLDLFINVEKLVSDGYRDNNTYDNTRLFTNLRYNLRDNLNLELIHFFSDVDALIPSSLSYSDFINNPSKAAFAWENINGGEKYRRSITGISLNIDKKKYQSNTSLFLKTFINEEMRPFNFLFEESISYGLRHYGKFLMKKYSLSYGVEHSYEYYHFDTYDDYLGDNQTLITHQVQDRNNYNFFLQYDKSFRNESNLRIGIGSNKINYKWTCCDNLELNSLEYKNKTVISPRLSYNYKLGDNSIFMNISHGFSSPNINETLDENGFVNPLIRPETGWNYELGIVGSTYQNNFSYSLNLYYMDIKNLLVAQRTSFDSFTGVNAGRTSHPGIETTFNFPIFNNKFFKIISSSNISKYWYTFKEFNHRGNDYNSNQLTGVPSHTFFSKIKFEYNKIIGQISFKNIGKIPINDSNELYTDGYSLVDMKLSKKIVSRSININLTSGINNLLDRKYASGVVINARGFGGREPRYYYPGLPRNYFISLTFSL